MALKMTGRQLAEFLARTDVRPEVKEQIRESVAAESKEEVGGLFDGLQPWAALPMRLALWPALTFLKLAAWVGRLCMKRGGSRC